MRRFVVAVMATAGLMIWAAPAGADPSGKNCDGVDTSTLANAIGGLGHFPGGPQNADQVIDTVCGR